MFVWNKTRKPKKRRRRSLAAPLLFSPTAWAKLVYLRDLGDTEVGGFAISQPSALLYIEDVQLVRQICSPTSVVFDDQSVADFFDSQVDLGRSPQEFGRIWVHTHPGDCPRPSMTDEETFSRVFGNTDWALMFILAQEGQTYARLQIKAGPGSACLLPVEIDFCPPFAASNETAWKQEYLANVTSWRQVLKAERLAAEQTEQEKDLRIPSPLAQTVDSQIERHDSRDGFIDVLHDRLFFGGDDPPFDFELQGGFCDGY